MLASGFTNAPVSKGLLFGVIGVSILASITDSKYLFHIDVVPHLWPYKQAWRLLIWQLCYTNSTELLFASMTIYHMRIIERLWGSSKFASFLTTTFSLCAIAAPTLVALALRPLSLGRLNYVPAGPTAAVFALLAQYHAAIPHVYKFRVATSAGSDSADSALPLFSDKSVTYLLAGQLALSQLPGSAVQAALGWAAGTAWRNGLLPARLVDWRLPPWLARRSGVTGPGGPGGRPTEGFDDLRRRLEGESRASGVDGPGGAATNAAEPRGRRGWVGGLMDGIRGAL